MTTEIGLNDNMDFVKLFEKKLCEYTGFRYAVTVDCCTNAILLSLEALNKLGLIDKNNEVLTIPNNTYLSVPMTLKNNGWKFEFKNIPWQEFYYVNKYVVDGAVFFDEGIASQFKNEDIICLSFQQKKRLSLGRGGAILTNDKELYELLLKLRYDGRDIDNFKSYLCQIRLAPDSILCGYHCYLEPDKAAQGILKLNQKNSLPEYRHYSYLNYSDISKLKAFK